MILLALLINTAWAGISPVLQPLLEFHPSWVSRMASSSDPTGGNGDGNGRPYEPEAEYTTLLHARGEGRVLRIWMTAPYDHQRKRPRPPYTYDELWIITDGITQYRGDAVDFFEGRANWGSPLVLGFEESSQAYLSYVPFAFQNEVKILFRGNPGYFQINYRQGTGSSRGVSPAELTEFLTENWTDKPASAIESVATVPGGGMLELFSGPATISWWSLMATPEALEALRVNVPDRVNEEPSVPFSFFAGFAASQNLNADFSNAVFSWSSTELGQQTVTSRLPLPLSAGDRVVLKNTSNKELSLRIWHVTEPLRPDVRLFAQYRDQPAHGEPYPMSFVETSDALNFVSLQHEISDGLPGNRLYLEGDEEIFTDSMRAPLLRGTGTEDYYNGGWYFSGPHANAFAGQPRFLVRNPEDQWMRARFEHSLYRHHITDFLVSRRDFRFVMESGPDGSYTPLRIRTLGLGYRFPRFRPKGQQYVSIRPSSVATVPCPPHATGAFVVLDYNQEQKLPEIAVTVNGRVAAEIFEGATNVYQPQMQTGTWLELNAQDCQNGNLELGLRGTTRPHNTEVTFY